MNYLEQLLRLSSVYLQEKQHSKFQFLFLKAALILMQKTLIQLQGVMMEAVFTTKPNCLVCIILVNNVIYSGHICKSC